MVAFHAAVHDGIIALLVDALLGHLGIDPVGIPPHVRTDPAELDRRRGVVPDRVHEGLVEVYVVQEDVRVMIPAVEVALDRLHRLDHAVEFLVPREDDEGGVRTRLAGVGLQAARDEDLVMLFADFPAVPLSAPGVPQPCAHITGAAAQALRTERKLTLSPAESQRARATALMSSGAGRTAPG